MSKAIQNLQGLERQIKELDSEEKLLSEQRNTLEKKLSLITKERNRLNNKIASLTREHPIVITDHARLRWLEYFGGVDLSPVDGEILPEGDRIIEALKKLGGTGKFPVGNSHMLVVQKGRIVTLYPQEKKS